MTKRNVRAKNLSPLPEGWRWVRLEEVLNSIESGKRPKGGAKDISRGVPSIGGEHLTWEGDFNFTKTRFIPKDFYRSMKKGKICIGDILVVKDGATTGKTAFINEDFPFKEAAVNEHVFILRSREETCQQKFLFYALRSPFGQEQIRNTFHGAAQGGINQKFVKGVCIPLPPLPEQRRIVARVEALMERIREAKRLREEARQGADRAETFPRPGSDLPQGWRWVRLGEVARREAVLLKPSDHPSKQVRYLGMEHVASGQWDQPQAVEVSGAEIKSQVVAFRPGLVLYGKLRPYLNKVVVPRTTGVASTEFVPIAPNADLLSPEYLSAFLRTPYFVAYAVRNTTGSRQPRTRIDALWNALIPLPPLPEQRRIVAHLETVRERVEALKKAQEETESRLKELERSILDKAFRGEL